MRWTLVLLFLCTSLTGPMITATPAYAQAAVSPVSPLAPSKAPTQSPKSEVAKILGGAPALLKAPPVEELAPPTPALQDAIGYVGGDLHGLGKILAIITTAMGALRALSEILSKVALLTGNVQAGVAAQAASTSLSYLAWFIGIFGLGAPKSVPGPAQIKAAAATKPNTSTPPPEAPVS